MFGVINRGGQRGRQTNFAPILGQAAERVDCTGDGDRIGGVQGHGFQATRAHLGGIQRGGRAS